MLVLFFEKKTLFYLIIILNQKITFCINNVWYLMFDIRDMIQQQLPWTGLSIWLVLTQMSRPKFMKKWTSYLVSPLQHISDQMQFRIKNILTSVAKWSTAKHIWSVIGGSDKPASMNDLKEMRYLECCIKVKYKIVSILQPQACGIFIGLLLSLY